MNVSFYIVIYNSSSGLSLSHCVRARSSTVLCIGRLHFMSHSILGALLYCSLWLSYAVLCYAVFDFFLPVCITFHFLSLSLLVSAVLAICYLFFFCL